MFLEGGVKDYDASVLSFLRELFEVSINNVEYKCVKVVVDVYDVEYVVVILV